MTAEKRQRKWKKVSLFSEFYGRGHNGRENHFRRENLGFSNFCDTRDIFYTGNFRSISSLIACVYFHFLLMRKIKNLSIFSDEFHAFRRRRPTLLREKVFLLFCLDYLKWQDLNLRQIRQSNFSFLIMYKILCKNITVSKSFDFISNVP